MARDKIDALRSSAAGMSPDQIEQAVVGLVLPWAGSAARQWYASEALPGVGDTPRGLVETGRTGLLLDYIRGIAMGSYA